MIPRALLFDEPLTGLDPIGIRRMKSTILKRAQAGAAIIISSHLLHLVEELCDRVLILNQGRKVIHGSLEEIQKACPSCVVTQVLKRCSCASLAMPRMGRN